MRLHDYLDYYARITPDILFSSFGERTLTYAEASMRANSFASLLKNNGIVPGDRVALLSRNSDDFPLIIAAVSKLGAVAVPLNYRLAAVEIDFILRDCEAKLLLVQTTEAQRLKLDGLWITLLIEDCSHPVEHVEDNGLSTDVVLQMYTSGTTGRPKGVLITHDALLINAHQLEIAIPYRLARGDRYLIVCPLYHAAAFISMVMTMRAGGHAVIHAEFEPADVVQTLAQDNIAAATLVPVMIGRCADWAGDQAWAFPALRHILYGASPISPTVLSKAAALFDCAFTQAFGLTETTSAATALTAEDHRAALGDEPHLLNSCGRALIGTTVFIDGESVGEICVSGPQLMQGYAGQPDATDAVLQQGAFRTGDAGKQDAQGYLTIEDRLKDMVISGGENIYSIEVENALIAHSGVSEAAVIGIPDDDLGEVLMAFYVAKGAVLNDDALIDHCRKMLAGYKIPRRYERVNALPRNPSGKVLKQQLRKPFWDNQERAVG
jgi:acyl-CoA synthetase (AMP-forming)/AMP-acid ligase II